MRTRDATPAELIGYTALIGYTTRLRSRTHGRGTFTTRPTGHRPAT